MNYKKLTIYALIINLLMNLIYFVDKTFLSDIVGTYLFFGILIITFILYYIKRYKIKMDKKVIKKDLLIAVLWIVISMIFATIFMELNVNIKPCSGIGLSCFLYGFDYIILGAINVLYAILILIINLMNLLLKKTKLSDKTNIIISIPSGIIIFSIIMLILGYLLKFL